MTIEDEARTALEAWNGAVNRGDAAAVASRWTMRGVRGEDGSETASDFATHVLEREPGGSLRIRPHTFN